MTISSDKEGIRLVIQTGKQSDFEKWTETFWIVGAVHTGFIVL